MAADLSIRRWLAALALCTCLAVPALNAASTPETIKRKVPGGNTPRIDRGETAAEFVPAKPEVTVAVTSSAGEEKRGEILIYDIRVNGVPAGKAQLEVCRKAKLNGDSGHDIIAVSMDVRSNRAHYFIYEVRNKARSLIDATGGFSRFYHITRKEGDIAAEERISFKYDIGAMEATYERPRRPQEKDDADKEWRTYKIPLTSKALDPLAALYYLRSVDFNSILAKEEDKRYFLLPICADRRLWNTKVYVHGPSPEDFAGLKNRDCICLVPQVEFKGLFERKGMFSNSGDKRKPAGIYIDKETKIPVRMTVEIPIGTAEVVLEKYENCALPPQK